MYIKLGNSLSAPRLLPIAYCLLPIAYCQLPIAYCLLPICYCLLHIAYCPMAMAAASVYVPACCQSCMQNGAPGQPCHCQSCTIAIPSGQLQIGLLVRIALLSTEVGMAQAAARCKPTI